MKRSTFLGSAAGVLLLFSVISYSRPFAQQEPKPANQAAPAPNPQPNAALATADPASTAKEAKEATTSAPLATSETAENVASATAPSSEKTVETVAVAPQSYTATAYSLRGHTASGRPVSRGLIAADPSVLPIGTRVRVEAGTWSGEYVVGDTGGAVRGRRIDIWTPTAREAMQFGRRVVKLTVLEFGGKQAKTATVRPRTVGLVPSNSPATQQTIKQEK